MHPGAAGLEAAADRHLQQVERGAWDPLQHGFRAVQGWEGVAEPLGVGVQWCGQDRLGRRHLHQLAGVHDADAIAELDHERQIVGDEQDGKVELLLERIDLLQDLPLHHHVQRRGRLVHDQQLGVEGHGDGDHQPLAHAAGELVRVIPQPARVDVDYLQQLLGTLDRLVAGQPRVVGDQHVAELLFHAQYGVERIHGGLEHHARLTPAVAAQPLVVEVQNILAGEADHLTRHDVKADRVDGAHVAALGDVVDAELAHRQQGLLRLHAVFS